MSARHPVPILVSLAIDYGDDPDRPQWAPVPDYPILDPDVHDFIAGLSTERVAQIMATGFPVDSTSPDEPARRVFLYRGMAEFFVAQLSLNDYQADPDSGIYPMIEIGRNDVAAVMLETDRLEEFAENQQAQIIELAPQDVVDRYRSQDMAERMLVDEPPMATGDATPSVSP